ncbi:Oidioi.mRNA.OKI2018_I69.chr1.g550.t1.cds [Oikopleura dioica]|uniref:Oidioi.mRNA.OKI2018_I69.chr1.g550.t1.cds n=1 Tax=Oikopleura dioica TaxID=34765 RepID=A0ABN7SSE1_OIKDI|nr:Oidioi.mRNA.OKI2018_I69.chr1.g550.t1.cds [Oikopleura dioica]
MNEKLSTNLVTRPPGPLNHPNSRWKHNSKNNSKHRILCIGTKEIRSDFEGLIARHRDTLQRKKNRKENMREKDEGFTGVRNMLAKFEDVNEQRSFSPANSPRPGKKPTKPPRPNFIPPSKPRNITPQLHENSIPQPLPRRITPPQQPPVIPQLQKLAIHEDYGTLKSIESIQTECALESSESSSLEATSSEFASFQPHPPPKSSPEIFEDEIFQPETYQEIPQEAQDSPSTPRKERRMSDETYERIMRSCNNGPEVVLMDLSEQLMEKNDRKHKRRPPIRPKRIAPTPPKTSPVLDIIESREQTPDLIPEQTRKEILKQRLNSFYSKEDFLKRKDYHFAIAEFLETIERTSESLRLLDSFYHQYGNNPEFSAIIESLPRIHRQILPELYRIHICFLAKVGVTDGKPYSPTPRSSTDSTSEEDHLEHLLDPIKIPQLIRSTYLDDPEFFDLLEKTIHEKAFDPVQESPHFSRLFQEFAKFLEKNGPQKSFGLDLMNISDLPYTRIFNLMNILEKIKKEAVKHEFENAGLCKRMFDEYQWTVKYRIEKPYADMRDYVCSSEAWGTMELPTVRHPFQSTSGQIDFSRFPRVHAVGDILIRNKKYRLGVWSNRIFLGKMKQKDSVQKSIFKVLFETHRCMVEVLENEEDGDEEQIDLVFLRFIEDKSDGNYRWRESRRIKFTPVDCKSPYKSDIQWHINKSQWLKVLPMKPTKQVSVKFFDENRPLFTLRSPFCTDDGSFYAKAGETFTAIRELKPPPDVDDRLFEGFFGSDEKFTFNFEIYESNLKIDKSREVQNAPKQFIQTPSFRSQRCRQSTYTIMDPLN